MATRSRREISERMALIRSKDTRPELIVRRLVTRLGFRYRLHRRDLPGTPDLAFIGRRKVIFVHGCFWHLHPGCRLARVPAARPDYWLPKLERNRARDRVIQGRLGDLGWRTLVVWECELRSLDALERRIVEFLQP